MWRVPETARVFRRRRPRPSPGFSLLELLVALSILSLIMSGLYFSLGSSAAHARRLRDSLEQHQAARRAIQRITADLGGVFVPPAEGSPLFMGTRGDGENGRADRVEFISLSHAWGQSPGKTGGFALITYWLSLAPDGNHLVRQERPLHGAGSAGQGPSMVVLEGVKELIFEYLDQQGARHDAWSGQGGTAVPAAVRVTVLLEAGGEKGWRLSTLVAIPAASSPPAQPDGAAPPAQGTPGGAGGGPGQ